MKPGDLTPREGKVLRFIVSTVEQPVVAKRLINYIEWSDLPHTLLQAKYTLERLRKLKLLELRSGGYEATDAGKALIKAANKAKIWQR